MCRVQYSHNSAQPWPRSEQSFRDLCFGSTLLLGTYMLGARFQAKPPDAALSFELDQGALNGGTPNSSCENAWEGDVKQTQCSQWGGGGRLANQSEHDWRYSMTTHRRHGNFKANSREAESLQARAFARAL